MSAQDDALCDIEEFGITVAKQIADILNTVNPTHDYTASYLEVVHS